MATPLASASPFVGKSPSTGSRAQDLDRSQVIELLVRMLRNKGETLAAEFERRIDHKRALMVKGVHVDTSMLEEALDNWDQEQGGPKKSALGSASSAGASVKASPANKASAGGGAGSKAPPSARWMPAAPTASTLTARALAECEHAEAFTRSVKIVGGSSVPILSKPDALADQLKEVVQSGQILDVVARYFCAKDGRVYLRRKAEAGWLSTRSLADMSKVVVAPLGGQAALEPPRCGEPSESSARHFLHEVASHAAAEPIVASSGGSAGSSAAGGAVTAVGQPEIDEESDFEGEEEEDDGPDDEELEGEGEGDLDGEAGPSKAKSKAATAKADGDAPSAPVLRKVKEKTFKVLVPKVPVISIPGAEQLMGSGHLVTLEHGEEFVADGACFLPAENRVYLRIKGDRGWVCEQSRTDIRKLAVQAVTRRRYGLSKKMAKAVAFHGGDAEGLTRLKKDDLVKNSQGKIVSKRASEAAKRRYADSGAAKWTEAVKRARTEMGIQGFYAVKKGTPVYDKAKEIYSTMKEA